MSVRRVDDEHVGTGLGERLRALERVGSDADRGADLKPTLRVLRRLRELDLLLDVLHGDEPAQMAVGVDDRELLDLVAMEDLLGLRERRPHRSGDEVARGHERRDELVDVVLEAKVAIREDPDEDPVVVGDRDARDLVVRHELERHADGRVGRQRHRLDDHPRLRALDLVDLRDLRLDREVAVDDADAALACERDREARLGHRVHRRGDERNCELDRRCQPCASRDIVREDVRLRRHEQDVVEGEAFLPELPVELQQPLNVCCARLGCGGVSQGTIRVPTLSAGPHILTTP